jgi:hypothetical protein
MTDREKLIELLNENFCEYCNVDIVAGHCKIRAITFDVDRFADFLIANGVTFQKWISVEDRLPDKNDDVLCSRGNHIGALMDVYTYVGDYKWCDTYGYRISTEDEGITHWMPLPEPPKENCNDKS